MQIRAVNRKVCDENCFLFTNKGKKMYKYQIKPGKKYDAFNLCLPTDQHLFVFGNDLTIFKDDLNDQSFCNEKNAYFDYGYEKQALFGQIGQFGIKRLRVIQLK